jgi:choline dehydrogenase-like flavoprotein
MKKYDICIVGSGAGAGGVAYTLSRAGLQVAILEKGVFYDEKDFSKDEIAFCRRDIVTPSLKDEYHTIEDIEDGKWVKTPTYVSESSFFNGSIVGGSSNFMSGFFHRLKPNDFRLLSTYGEINGANIVDWAISYEDMEPYYEKVERIVGVSGEVIPHKHQEPRSTKDFPYPPTQEHPISKLIDKSCKELKFSVIKTPRAILSVDRDGRNSCYYSNYCGSYGCSSGAKGSARAALLIPALKSENLNIISNAHVTKLISKDKKVTSAQYITKQGVTKNIDAKIFVVAAQAIESCRLLLNSKNSEFPNGLANNNNQVGKNLIFSAGGAGSGEFDSDSMNLKDLMVEGVFVNRTVQDWYYTKDKKGGIIEFLFEHANPIPKASKQRWRDGNLIWGKELQDRIYNKFKNTKQLNFEVFNDWLPNDNCFVSVDEKYIDKYNMPVANIRIGSHQEDIKVGQFLAQKAEEILKKMGAKNVSSSISSYPPPNLQAGGCRFGDDPKISVLNKYCQSHEVDNLFVTDGSFMPTGGSVPFTWTIYANSFRVADYILKSRF